MKCTGCLNKNASVAFCLLLMQPCKVSFIFFHIFPRSKVLSNRNCIKENKWYHHIFHVQESTTPNLVPPSFVILVLLHFSLTLRVRRDSVWYLREFNTCYSNHCHVSAINSTYWNIFKKLCIVYFIVIHLNIIWIRLS